MTKQNKFPVNRLPSTTYKQVSTTSSTASLHNGKEGLLRHTESNKIHFSPSEILTNDYYTQEVKEIIEKDGTYLIKTNIHQYVFKRK